MKYISYSNTTFKNSEYYQRIPVEERKTIDILFRVFHFKVNNYVLEELIDWSNVPNDPIYKLAFPRKDMLTQQQFAEIEGLISCGANETTLASFISKIRKHMPVIG